MSTSAALAPGDVSHQSAPPRVCLLRLAAAAVPPTASANRAMSGQAAPGGMSNTGTGVGVGVGEGVGRGAGVDVGGRVGVAVGIGVRVGVGLGVAVAVGVGLGVRVGLGLGVGVGVGVEVGTGLGAAVDVRMIVTVGDVPESEEMPGLVLSTGGKVGEAGGGAVLAPSGASSISISGGPPIWHPCVQLAPARSTK